MDFSDILSYPSPSNDVCHQVLSSDLYTCQRYLEACARLVHFLSDREIDIKSVHYKYRIERFLRSRSKLSRKFITIYEQRFPELAISKDQLFIFEPNGNVRIDTSHPTATSKKTPPINKSPSSSPIVEEKSSVSVKSKKKKRSLVECLKERHSNVNSSSNNLTCWTVAIYVPRRSLLPTIEHLVRSSTPIKLPWIVKRPRVEISEYDLRTLFHQERAVIESCDLRLLFCEDKIPAVEYDLSQLFEERLYVGTQNRSFTPALTGNEQFENNWDLLLYLLIVCYIIVALVIGIELSLMCYASLGVLAYIHHVVEIGSCF